MRKKVRTAGITLALLFFGCTCVAASVDRKPVGDPVTVPDQQFWCTSMVTLADVMDYGMKELNRRVENHTCGYFSDTSKVWVHPSTCVEVTPDPQDRNRMCEVEALVAPAIRYTILVR